MTQAHVICNNDSVEHVHLGTEAEADLKLSELRLEHFDRHPHGYHVSFVDRNKLSDEDIRGLEWKAYKQRCYWHIHTVGLTQGT